ncbi:hypothetical protein [Methylobacterium terricola]|uniref:hypothetical protein n=1 Tax=Methylobacterium terricola TaxID=2583531 RepID=UPI00148716DD|nr:hypothetical protein [Methylobacterium terricola]
MAILRHGSRPTPGFVAEKTARRGDDLACLGTQPWLLLVVPQARDEVTTVRRSVRHAAEHECRDRVPQLRFEGVVGLSTSCNHEVVSFHQAERCLDEPGYRMMSGDMTHETSRRGRVPAHSSGLTEASDRPVLAVELCGAPNVAAVIIDRASDIIR